MRSSYFPYSSESSPRPPLFHHVDVAETGNDAKVLIDNTPYDLISLDYVLPGGVTGMDVYHHIRESDHRVSILFTSGNIEFLESVKELKQADTFVDHIPKPYSNKDYAHAVDQLLIRGKK